jgi:hypothetical protein
VTAPKRPAIDEAADIIDSVRATYAPIPYVPARFLLDAIPNELLRRMADERDMAKAVET